MPKLSSLFRLPGARPSSPRASSRKESEVFASRSGEGLRAQHTRNVSIASSISNASTSASSGAPATNGMSASGMKGAPSRLNGQPVTNGTINAIGSATTQASDEAIDETATRRETHETELTSVEALQPGLGSGSSGVYVVKREIGHEIASDSQAPHGRDPHHDELHHDEEVRRTIMMNPLLEHVTLVVYGWHNVEPGTLAWVFPSVTAAVAAARAMKNAVRWAIVAGRREASDDDLVEARAHGAVLIEQAG